MRHRFYPGDYFLIWLALVSMGLFFRPLTPVDETRVVSVAWEMWQRGDFLVPHLNGEPYSHKPPLLPWCIQLTWWVFGVNEWSARLVAPLFGLGALVLTADLARRLWPQRPACHRLAPLFLLAMPLWSFWTSLTLYDMLMAFFTLLGLQGVIRAAQGETRAGWALAGLALGGGLLSKGPVILLLILPSALFAPAWLKPKPGWGRWYLSLLAAILLGAVIALAWAIPAGYAGGEAYRKLIFWGQSAGRLANSFAHQRPFCWYLELLPVLLFPWLWWPPLWRSARSCELDLGLRFCIIHSLSILLAFSLISGKQIHYLLPLYPLLALVAARILGGPDRPLLRFDQVPIGLLLTGFALAFVMLPQLNLEEFKNEAEEIAHYTPLWAKLVLVGIGASLPFWRFSCPQQGVHGLTLAMLALMFTAHLIYREVGWHFHDLQPFADRLSAAERSATPIAYWSKYNGDFNFLGRLRQPLVEIDSKTKMLEWMKAHGQGYVVLTHEPDPSLSEEGAAFAQAYRGSRRLMLWKASALLSRPETLAMLIDDPDWSGDSADGAGKLLLEKELDLPSSKVKTRLTKLTIPQGGNIPLPSTGPRYVVRGQLKVEQGSSIHVYGPGEAFWQSGPPMRAENVGKADAQLLLIDLGSDSSAGETGHDSPGGQPAPFLISP
ncbi:MAG: glycosyltransferase family 39 protein [Methylococcaceae bacterium]|nr:glycosyltransferase family 39 protein [Methylococcaceae bacterium]